MDKAIFAAVIKREITKDAKGKADPEAKVFQEQVMSFSRISTTKIEPLYRRVYPLQRKFDVFYTCFLEIAIIFSSKIWLFLKVAKMENFKPNIFRVCRKTPIDFLKLTNNCKNSIFLTPAKKCCIYLMKITLNLYCMHGVA